jgi:hypothetical protein
MSELQKPKVGSYVRVTTDYTAAKRGFHWLVPRKSTNIGKVVESQDWEGENTFALLTSDPKMPIKTIDMKWVVGIEKIRAADLHVTDKMFRTAEKEIKAEDKVFEVKSTTRSKTYAVVKSGMNWSCNCEAGQRGRRCKHITEAQSMERLGKVKA